ncbi:methylaspartate mutase [Amycolatopsis sp. WAC 01375]|uniref:methylaspartate mutase n=1 Tax=Amycolatopsis sp. WAC 01375 TaxID=2203194 RepID=UPI000F7BAD4D|nr:methylaspartate mutase [Amycolatopsis sp. WAC 01375]RSM82620.1 methylaspartate mutase [Amycolatopsis sp. WAC 01375]
MSVRPPSAASVDFGEHVLRVAAAGGLVVQPRMGVSDPARMRAGLLATRGAAAHTVGTVTLDSYTRVGATESVAMALRKGESLNGYPILGHDRTTTSAMLNGVLGLDFPVQVRHGSAAPLDIFAAMAAVGLAATEGGPVSYCLPYGRVPLAEAVANWARCCQFLAAIGQTGLRPHLETFGGCMLGQLCPPSQLVAMSVLEALFFQQHGVRSVSVSYAQQTDMDQDTEAVLALRRLCRDLLPYPGWHVVVYTYMGVYPTTEDGAFRLLGLAVELARRTGAERLIVKTAVESARIPSFAENVEALEYAALIAERAPGPVDAVESLDSQTYQEARALVHAVLDLDDDIGRALLAAFRIGFLDIPYCLHPDNAGRTQAVIDDRGWLRWAETGALPIGHLVERGGRRSMSSSGLLSNLNHVRDRFDTAGWDPAALHRDRTPELPR